MLHRPFYDPLKTYEENFNDGPFGVFGDGKIMPDEREPANNFLGQKIGLPFGIPAGPLLNGRFVRAAFDKGFDLCTYKTVRSRKYPCHPWPNVLAVDLPNNLTLERAEKNLIASDAYQEPLSITNSFGVPSANPDFWQEDIKRTLGGIRPGQALIGSFQGTKQEGGNLENYVADFVLCARLLKETGIKIMEVNLSCPNEGTANVLCYDISNVRKVTEAIKNEIGNTPLVIKIAYFKEQSLLKALAEEIGNIIDGVAAINTIAAPIIGKDGAQALSGEGRLRSGVCGQAIKWAGLEMTARLKSLRDELGLSYAIVGVGGANSIEDYHRYILAGADAVMSATGAMWNPYLAQEIKKSV